MMIRAATTDPFSFADVAAVLAGLFVVGALVLWLSICAQDSPSISDFLHRTQSEADASRFHDLLGALDESQRASHGAAAAERSGSEDSQTASPTGTALPASTTKREEIKLLEHGGDAGRDELRAMYDRAIGPGVLKPHRTARGTVRAVQPGKVDL